MRPYRTPHRSAWIREMLKPVFRAFISVPPGAKMVRIGVLLAAFGAGGLSCGDEGYSPCDRSNSYVLEITRIFDETSSASLISGTLSDFSIDGVPVAHVGSIVGPAPGGLRGREVGLAEVVTHDSLRCFAPCKLGADSGTYRFRVSAAEFDSKDVELFADWPIKRYNSGGCKEDYDGQTRIEIGLQRKR